MYEVLYNELNCVQFMNAEQETSPLISSSFEVVQVIHEKLLDMVGKVQ